MKRAYVLVEGPSDAAFLRKVLPPETLKDIEVVAAGSSIPSLARSLLVRRRLPLAVFMDSDSLDANAIEERRQGTEEIIKSAAASVPVKVVVVVPELERLFFAAPELIEKVLAEQVPENLIPIGIRDPKGVLKLLEKSGKHPWDTFQAINIMDAADIERIRATSAIQELIAFLEGLPEMEAIGSQEA